MFGQKSEWSDWGTISCYKGLQGSCINLGYVKSIDSYSWNVRIKNNYNRKANKTPNIPNVCDAGKLNSDNNPSSQNSINTCKVKISNQLN